MEEEKKGEEGQANRQRLRKKILSLLNTGIFYLCSISFKELQPTLEGKNGLTFY